MPNINNNLPPGFGQRPPDDRGRDLRPRNMQEGSNPVAGLPPPDGRVVGLPAPQRRVVGLLKPRNSDSNTANRELIKKLATLFSNFFKSMGINIDFSSVFKNLQAKTQQNSSPVASNLVTQNNSDDQGFTG